MNIGVLATNFTHLAGAYDFINHIVLALSYQAQENNGIIYVFLQEKNLTKQFYRQYKGLKRLLKKVQFLYSINKQNYIKKKIDKFPQYRNVKYVLYHERVMNDIIKRLNIDCIFPVTDYNMQINIPNIRYLYDCQHKYYPEYFSKEEIAERDKYFTEMCKHYCIVNSHDTKNDLVKFYNADENKIFALPFTPKVNGDYLKDNSDLIQKYNLAPRFFLVSNQFWIHKDHPTIFRAFAKLLQEDERYNDVELVCTGEMTDYRRPKYIDELKALIDNLGIKNKVHLLGLIPKIEQIEIMKKAQAVVSATLFEGGPGGGSVWDACALGIRSIVSDIPVNLEINNTLVTFFQTGNPDDLSKKMKIVLNANFSAFSKEQLLKNNNKNLQILGQELYRIFAIVMKN